MGFLSMRTDEFLPRCRRCIGDPDIHPRTLARHGLGRGPSVAGRLKMAKEHEQMTLYLKS